MRMKVCFVVAAILAVGSASGWTQSNPEPSANQTQDGAAAVVPPGSKDKPVRVSSGVMAGLILHKVDLIYPEDARESNVSGAVVMMATIDDHGKIVKLSVIAGPEKLRDAALTAVNQWTYKPYLLNGNPVFVNTQITVNFSLTH